MPYDHARMVGARGSRACSITLGVLTALRPAMAINGTQVQTLPTESVRLLMLRAGLQIAENDTRHGKGRMLASDYRRSIPPFHQPDGLVR